MLARIDPDASEALRLAARCQHIERWKIPRAEYPMTRAGYQQWRTRLRDFHADRAGAILRDAGYDDATIGRVRALIRKEALKSDAEAQALEDVVALVFLESYLEDFVATHAGYDEAKFVDILRKTAQENVGARTRRGADADLAAHGAVAGDQERDGRAAPRGAAAGVSSEVDGARCATDSRTMMPFSERARASLGACARPRAVRRTRAGTRG